MLPYRQVLIRFIANSVWVYLFGGHSVYVYGSVTCKLEHVTVTSLFYALSITVDCTSKQSPASVCAHALRRDGIFAACFHNNWWSVAIATAGARPACALRLADGQ